MELAGPADWILWLLMFLAISGFTVVHLAVLAWRHLVQKPRWKRKRDPEALARVEAVVQAEASRLTLTFVVPAHNEELTIGPCIESLLAQSVRPDAIIVVDDASTDRTFEKLASFRARGVQVLRFEKNVGKARAIEAAVGHVRTDLVAITDADSLVDREYTREIKSTFVRRPGLSGVAGNIMSMPHTWVTAARQIEYVTCIEIDRAAEDVMSSILVMPGVSTTYRVDALRAVGFEHDTIAEDIDLTFRMHKAGRKLALNMRAKVYTSDPPTLRAYYKQLMRWFTDIWLTIRKHTDLVGKKTFGRVELPMVVVTMLAGSVLVFAVPVYLAIADPAALPAFFFWQIVWDAAFAVGCAMYMRRIDLLWGIASRYPTRLIGRYVTLVTFVRVILGRPGMAWGALERRRTDPFLAKAARTART